MNTFHLPVAAVAFGFLLGCGGFTFIALFSRLRNRCCYMMLLYSVQISYYIFRKHES
jgi:hypothetical protein